MDSGEIFSKENAHIKYVKKLMISSKFRKKEKSFVVEGVRICEEALKCNAEILKIFYTENFKNKFSELFSKLKNSAAEIFLVKENLINAISDTDTPQGIVAVCRDVDKNINEDKIKSCTKIVLLENIQNPTNMGSILRTCDALGVNNIGIIGNSCDIHNPKVLRGSMGALFRLNFFVSENGYECMLKLKKMGFKIYAAMPREDSKRLQNIDFSGKCAVVFGNEGNGVEKETEKKCDYSFSIPMQPKAESLNVSVAAGIVIWEMTRS